MSLTLNQAAQPATIVSSTIYPGTNNAQSTRAVRIASQPVLMYGLTYDLAHDLTRELSDGLTQVLDKVGNIAMRQESAADQLKRLPSEPNFSLSRFAKAQHAPNSILQRLIQRLRGQGDILDKVGGVTHSKCDTRRWTPPRYLGDTQRLAVYVSWVTLLAHKVMDALKEDTFVLGQTESQFLRLLADHEASIQNIANDYHYQDPRVRPDERVLHAKAQGALRALRQRLGEDASVTSEALMHAEHYLRDAYQTLHPADELIPYTLPRLLDPGRIRQFGLATAHCGNAETRAAAREEVQQVMQNCFDLDKHVPRPTVTDKYKETYF